MKVLIINTVYRHGSTGKIVYEIQEYVRKKGEECIVAFGRGKEKSNSISKKFSNKLSVIISAIITRIFDSLRLGNVIDTIRLVKYISKYNPDVIHLNNLHGYYLNIKILFNYLHKEKIPVIWTLHDCWAITGHCVHFDYVSCEKWKVGCHHCVQKSTYPTSYLFDNSKNNYKLKKKLFCSIEKMIIITPSNWLRDIVKSSFLKDYEVYTISNGIDLDKFVYKDSDFRVKHKIMNKYMILGVADGWGVRKGFEYFLQLSNILENEYVIVLVGLNKNQIKNIPKNIIGIERTRNIDELVDIYSSADVFVNPTLEEVFGLVNIEALACNTPVITFNTGGSIECIDNESGIIVEKGSVKGLYNAIIKIRKNKIYSSRALERSKLFDSSITSYKYHQIYKKVVYKE